MTRLSNTTRNQHFLTRTEQKLNALNSLSTSGKFRIYSFRLENRDTLEIELENPRGRPIDSTLSMLDLFSFDVPGGSDVRHNLEALFHKYETDIETHTRNLLEKISIAGSDINTEIKNIFAAKLLNFVRNPFCIEKVLNSLPDLTFYEPTDLESLATYRDIAGGRRPQQAYICRKLGITDRLYVEWLRLLFMLLMDPGKAQPTLFDALIESLFNNRSTQASAFVNLYDNEYCLLSDRSYCQAIPDGPHMSMSFNLTSRAFVDYAFSDPAALLEGRVPPAFLESAINNWRRRPMATINVTVTRNNVDMLARYNRRAIEQCFERVYCSTKEGLLVADEIGEIVSNWEGKRRPWPSAKVAKSE